MRYTRGRRNKIKMEQKSKVVEAWELKEEFQKNLEHPDEECAGNVVLNTNCL